MNAEDCVSAHGIFVTYSPEGTIVFEEVGEEEPYEIRGAEIHFFNPFDGAMGHDLAEPLDDNIMRLTQLNGEQHQLVRCNSRPKTIAAENVNHKPERTTPKDGREYTDAELYGIYEVKLSCVDIHGRKMPLVGCFAGTANPGRVGYIDANNEFSYSEMQLMTGLNQTSETFALTAPFTFYAQSFGETPLLLLGQVLDGDEVVEERTVASGDTIAFGREAIQPPVADEAEYARLVIEDAERKAAELEALIAE